MENEGLVSVIIPVYNAENYICRCISSVLASTYQQIEVILIDDGSTDNSLKVCEEFCKKDNRIYIYHKENGGVSSARNMGIEKSNGAYLMFIDADDELTSDCIEILMNNIKSYSADLSGGRATTDNYQWEFDDQCGVWKGTEALEKSILDSPLLWAAWGKLYTRKIVGETRFVETIKVNEDALFVFMICCKQPKCVFTQEIVYVYNLVTSSASRSPFSNKFLDILVVSKMKEQQIRKEYPKFLNQTKIITMNAQLNLLRILCNRTKDEYKELEIKLIKELKRNKKCYISTTKTKDRWMFIIQHHLYFIYKKYNGLRKNISIKSRFLK